MALDIHSLAKIGPKENTHIMSIDPSNFSYIFVFDNACFCVDVFKMMYTVQYQLCLGSLYRVSVHCCCVVLKEVNSVTLR